MGKVWLHALTAAVVTVGRQSPCAAVVKGAFEMDAEFYLRNALGVPPPPTEAIPIAAARELDSAFVSHSLEAVEDSISVALSISVAELRAKADKKRQGLALEYGRVLSSGAFGTKGYDVGGFTALRASPTSQFGFDLSLLALFTLLADARLSRAEVQTCSQRLGDQLLKHMPSMAPVTSGKLSEVISGIRRLLGSLKASGYTSAFSIDDSDVDDNLWAQRSSLSETRLTITLSDSASLRAALVLNGRAGASPELARPLLMSYLRQAGVEVAETTDYFLDDTYRSNPSDYRPNQQVLTLLVRPAA